MSKFRDHRTFAGILNMGSGNARPDEQPPPMPPPPPAPAPIVLRREYGTHCWLRKTKGVLEEEFGEKIEPEPINGTTESEHGREEGETLPENTEKEMGENTAGSENDNNNVGSEMADRDEKMEDKSELEPELNREKEHGDDLEVTVEVVVAPEKTPAEREKTMEKTTPAKETEMISAEIAPPMLDTASPEI
ncbi:hypothetical protein L2E82_15853 [Cichorium intybus]|uniref:Uncharacterized protein n=1 Tax=Cichorium intybus TaxID=13427 RepID=A0ACB9F3J2_CICIN|nr:hypothetical protein L2E82_15853 [Cichorium intybus]